MSVRDAMVSVYGTADFRFFGATQGMWCRVHWEHPCTEVRLDYPRESAVFPFGDVCAQADSGFIAVSSTHIFVFRKKENPPFIGDLHVTSLQTGTTFFGHLA